MDNVVKLARAQLPALARKSKPPPNVPESTSTDLGTIARIWMVGLGLWARKWEREYGRTPFDERDQPTADALLWARQLAGFDRNTILAALEAFASRGNTWPPNLPELRRACFGLPSFTEAKAAFGDTGNAFTLLLRRQLDEYLLARADQHRAEAMLRDAYELACQKVMQGEPLPVVPPRLAAEERPYVPPSPEQLAAHFARIRASLGIG